MKEKNEKVLQLKILKMKLPITFVTVVFGFILVYFLIQGIVLLCTKSVDAYNVRTPISEATSGTFCGLILRDELIFTSPESGEVDFYETAGDWVSKDGMIASVDASGNLWTKLHEVYYNKQSLSDTSVNKIQSVIRNATKTIDSIHFSTISEAKSEIQSTIFECLLKDQKNAIAAELSDVKYTLVTSDETGFFVNWMDGFEIKKVDGLTSADFSQENYKKTTCLSGSQVKTSDFIYKLIKNNSFKIAFLMTNEEKLRYQDRTKMKILVNGLEITGTFSVSETLDGKFYGLITFAKYGGNFIDDRFVSFQIVEEQVTGFKIPESSIVTKDFFVVPSDYVTQGGASNNKGVLLETGDSVKFLECVVYEQSVDSFVIGDDVCYIGSSELEAGKILINPVDQSPYALGRTASVEGVYQINHGYCVYKPINRLASLTESSYVMIQSNARYSISSYDRIVLNAKRVKENEIVYE